MKPSLCPVCSHGEFWSVGKLRRRWFSRWRRGFNKWGRVRYYYCSFGEGADWASDFCGCQHLFHKVP